MTQGKGWSEHDDLVRLSVLMNRPTAETLRRYAERHHVRVTGAVQRAVALSHFLDQEKAEGSTIVIVYPDGREAALK